MYWFNVDVLFLMELHHLAVHADQTQAPWSHKSAAQDWIQRAIVDQLSGDTSRR